MKEETLMECMDKLMLNFNIDVNFMRLLKLYFSDVDDDVFVKACDNIIMNRKTKPRIADFIQEFDKLYKNNKKNNQNSPIWDELSKKWIFKCPNCKDRGYVFETVEKLGREYSCVKPCEYCNKNIH